MTQSKMQQQLVRSGKSQAALVAYVGPSLEVNVFVLLQSLRLRELAAAVLTLERLLPSVVAHVGRMLRWQQERLGTQAARVRALVGMNSLVSVEVINAGETLATRITSVRTFTRVSTNMKVQIADLRTTIATTAGTTTLL